MGENVFKGRQDIPEQLHPVCTKCIDRARQKYNGITSLDGMYYEDGFGVGCPYIPHDETYFPSRLRSQMSPDEWSMANSFKAALLWGEANLLDPDTQRPWRAWPYQRGPLLCQSPRKCYRFGRRCLPGGTPILMADGSWKAIEEVRPGERVVSRNSKAQNVSKRVLNFWENGEKDIIRVTLTNGMTVDCTPNHPFFTYVERDVVNHRGVTYKWMSAEEGLKPGMKVAVLGEYQKWGNESHLDLGKLLGYLLTDGYIVGGGQTPKFTNNNRRMIDEVREIAGRLFGYGCSLSEKGNGWDVYITDGNRGTSNKLLEELAVLGLLGRKASNKIIPEWIYSWDKESVMCLINRLFSGDGGIFCHQKLGRKDGEFATELSLSSTSHEMLVTVKLLLLKVGVQAYINRDGKPDEAKGYVQRWKLKISSRDSIRSFFENVGLIFGKEDRCLEVIEALKNRTRGHKGVRKHCRFVSIKSIEPAGRALTYDIEVEDTHNMVSCGIYTHNTGKTIILAVEVLWYLFTSCGGKLRDEQTHRVRQNLEVLVLAPQKVHINLIFSKMRAFLNLSPSLRAAVKTDTRGSPQMIGLATRDGGDGNKVAGYASGDSSGSKGLAARGQCLARGTLVTTSDGSQVPIEDLAEGASVCSYSPAWTAVTSKVTRKFSSEFKELFRLETRAGRTLDLSAEHRIFTPEGERTVGELGPGALIAIPRLQAVSQPASTLSVRELKILGYLIGDGYINKEKISFCSANEETIEEYCSLFLPEDTRVEQKSNNLAKDIVLKGQSFQEVRELVRANSLLGSHSWDKFVPAAVKSADSTGLQAFLSRLYSTDGWASLGSNLTTEIGYCTTSKVLADDIVYLLSRFGIVGRIHQRQKTLGGKLMRSQYIVAIKDSKGIIDFCELVGIFGKSSATGRVCEAARKKNVAYDRTRRRYDGDIYWDEVKSIRPLGPRECFDIEVAATNKFVANGIVVHNSADLVILDEGAYVSEEVMNEVISPILYTRPTTTFIISSTPSGISQDYFEKVCTMRPDFVEFYVPASERPDWDRMEAQVRKEFGGSEEEWKQEVMAEFSPAGIGVYRDDLVKMAQQDYEYGSRPRHGGAVYTFGVDWNKEHGTEIAVIETSKASPHISWVVYCENISKEDFTTPFGVQRIIELNRIWQPSWIYVDAGGGDGGQTLRHHGRQMIGKDVVDARLKDIVKAIDFGSKMDIVEAAGRIVPLPVKPFMVNNSVKKFEIGEFRYPRSDLTLTRQLNNYIVARRTPAGIPTYGLMEEKYGDHRLDAVNLALLAVRLEFSSFTGEGLGPMVSQVAYAPPIGNFESPRAILPAFAPISRRPVAPSVGRELRVNTRPVPSRSKGSVVTYWGTEPEEHEAEGRAPSFGRHLVRRIGR